MSKEPEQQMIIQDDEDLDTKLQNLMFNDGTVYAAYKTGELLGMSKTKLYANIILLLAAEKQKYFDMAVEATANINSTPLNLKGVSHGKIRT